MKGWESKFRLETKAVSFPLLCGNWGILWCCYMLWEQNGRMCTSAAWFSLPGLPCCFFPSSLVALKVRGNKIICLYASWFSLACGLFIYTWVGGGGGADGISSEYFLWRFSHSTEKTIMDSWKSHCRGIQDCLTRKAVPGNDSFVSRKGALGPENELIMFLIWLILNAVVNSEIQSSGIIMTSAVKSQCNTRKES